MIGKPQSEQRLVHAPLGVGGELRRLAPAIGEELQGPRRGDGGIELAQGSRRGVARIGEGAFAALGLPFVEALEGCTAHVDFAAHFEGVGKGLGPDVLGNVGDGADIGRDVLALIAVAAGGALHEPALLVAKGDGQSVDLGLGGEGQPLDGVET